MKINERKVFFQFIFSIRSKIIHFFSCLCFSRRFKTVSCYHKKIQVAFSQQTSSPSSALSKPTIERWGCAKFGSLSQRKWVSPAWHYPNLPQEAKGVQNLDCFAIRNAYPQLGVIQIYHRKLRVCKIWIALPYEMRIPSSVLSKPTTGS